MYFIDPDGQFPIPLITGVIGAAGGALYGVVTGKSGKEIAALAGGGFVGGATLGFGTVAVGALGGTAILGATGTSYVMGASGIIGGVFGNIAEQSIRNIGTSNTLDGNEVVVNAAFSIPSTLLGGLAGKVMEGTEKGLTKYFSSKLSEDLSKESLKSFKKEITGELREQGLGRGQANKVANQAIKQYKTALKEGFEATSIGVKVSGKAADVTLHSLQVGTMEQIKQEIKNDN